MFLLSVILAFTYVSSQQLAPAQSLTRLPMLWCIRLYLSQYNITTPHRFESLNFSQYLPTVVPRCRAVEQWYRSKEAQLFPSGTNRPTSKFLKKHTVVEVQHEEDTNGKYALERWVSVLRLNVRHNLANLNAFDDPVHNYATCT